MIVLPEAWVENGFAIIRKLSTFQIQKSPTLALNNLLEELIFFVEVCTYELCGSLVVNWGFGSQIWSSGLCDLALLFFLREEISIHVVYLYLSPGMQMGINDRLLRYQQHCHGPTQGRGRKNTVSCFHDTEITVWASMAFCTFTLSKMEQSETYPFRCQAGSTNIEECCFRFSCYSFRLKIKMNKSTMCIYHNVDFQCGCGT